MVCLEIALWTEKQTGMCLRERERYVIGIAKNSAKLTLTHTHSLTHSFHSLFIIYPFTCKLLINCESGRVLCSFDLEQRKIERERQRARVQIIDFLSSLKTLVRINSIWTLTDFLLVISLSLFIIHQLKVFHRSFALLKRNKLHWLLPVT